MNVIFEKDESIRLKSETILVYFSMKKIFDGIKPKDWHSKIVLDMSVLHLPTKEDKE